MPTLTPIPLSVEEHERLTKVKHQLEASSWRDMLNKLCDIYEDLYQKDDTSTMPTKTNIEKIIEKVIDKKLKAETPEGQPKKGSLLELFKQPRENPQQKEKNPMNEETIRKIVKEEMENWKIELPPHDHKPQEEFEPCPKCGATLSKNKKPEFCPTCDTELDWEQD